MGKCTLCHTPGVNKSTCPLNAKDATEEQWSKHYMARRRVKPTSSHSKKMLVVHGSTSVGVTPHVLAKPIKKSNNPYVKKTEDVKIVKNKIMRSAEINKKIILHGTDLLHFHMSLKNPEELTIKINKTESKLKELNNILQLILDIYHEMSKLTITRSDFFTNPSDSTKVYISLLNDTKNKLTEFIVKNYDGPGGGNAVPSFTVPLDEIIQDLDRLASSEQLAFITSLPKAPTEIPKLKNTEKKVAVYARGTRKQLNRKQRKTRKHKK